MSAEKQGISINKGCCMEKSNSLMKSFCFLSIIAVASSLTGCTAILWSANNPIEHGNDYRTEIKDSVSGAVEYKNLQLSTLQSSKKTPIDVPSEGVAFIGHDYIYFLTKGADQLLELNDNVNNLPYYDQSGDGILRFDLKDHIKNNVLTPFSNTFTVIVRNEKLTTEQITLLKKLGFIYTNSRYEKEVYIGGVIVPRKNLNYNFGTENKLAKAYQVEFYTSKYKTKLNPGNIVENIVITPVALAADIIFFPISLKVLHSISH